MTPTNREELIALMAFSADVADDKAKTMLDAMTKAGLAVVPTEPNPETLGAFYRVKNGHHFYDEMPPTDTSDYAAYRAMIAVCRIDGGSP